MDQNQEQEEVLIARNNETGQVGAVTGLNEDGTPKMTDVKSAKLSDLVKFQKGQNPIEAFLSNFVRQCQNPTTFGFFRVPADRYETVGTVIGDLAKDPVANAEMLKNNVVEIPKKAEEQELKDSLPKQETPKEEPPKESKYHAIDPAKINWEEFSNQWGVNKEQLEKSGDLDKMLNYGKSGLVRIYPTLAGEKLELEVRLSLKTDSDGNIRLVPHPIYNKPNLEREYRGYQFTAEDKEQLLKTGNLGKVVELNGKNGEKVPSYVSIDRLTNQVVSMSAKSLFIKGNIGRTELTPEEIAILKEGKPIIDKQITRRDGKTFTTTLQVNADARSVEFVPKAWQNHKEDYAQSQQQRNGWTDADGNIRPIGKWKGIPFTDRQKEDYVNGKTVVLTNAVDKEGQPCTLYVKFNPKIQRPLSYTENPDLKQAVAPSNDSATQIAVNNEGKTNEATNKIREPLQQGQTSPKDEDQQKKQKKGPKL